MKKRASSLSDLFYCFLQVKIRNAMGFFVMGKKASSFVFGWFVPSLQDGCFSRRRASVGLGTASLCLLSECARLFVKGGWVEEGGGGGGRGGFF